jgi:hypothetical protein
LWPGRFAAEATSGVQTSATSVPVITRATPGIAAASAASIDRMRAWACGLRTNAACSMRGTSMSSV